MDPLVLIVSLSIPYIVYTSVALGNALVERSGVLNLSIDGLFVLGVAIAYTLNVVLSLWLGSGAIFIAIVATAMIVSLVGIMRTYLVSALPIPQGALGLSIMFLCYGLAALIGNLGLSMFSSAAPEQRLRIGYITATPNASIAFYTIAITIAVAVNLLINRTKLGVMIRASGDDPRVVSYMGANLVKVRLVSSAIGDFLVGLGSAIYTLCWVTGWKQDYGLNHGWLAYAISVAGGRSPILVAILSIPFSSLYYAFSHLQALGVPVDIAKLMPYAAAIAATVTYSITPIGRKWRDPKYLGREFYREERAM
ncbi:MAG TPA: hypothetical protein VNL13_04130 [Sulfolobales archaeon]|nr:hypothetical protein [Sulfolobales archaeon]